MSCSCTCGNSGPNARIGINVADEKPARCERPLGEPAGLPRRRGAESVATKIFSFPGVSWTPSIMSVTRTESRRARPYLRLGSAVADLDPLLHRVPVLRNCRYPCP